MEASGARVLLIEPDPHRRALVVRRLQTQGYVVEPAADAACGADLALRAPPSAIVADVWMAGISGVQLCRLLRSEPATASVPVILCGDEDEPRDRFWAGRAGASAYVVKGRTGELVRAIAAAIDSSPEEDGFFTQLAGGSVDIRDRLARHLDDALFDSVVAAEIRALSTACDFDRLFDRLVQFLSQVARYRWFALSTTPAARCALHNHPSTGAIARREARGALGVDDLVNVSTIEDEDASPRAEGPETIVCDVLFGPAAVARLACAPVLGRESETRSLLAIVRRELGGAVKIATLVEESERLASIDALTGLSNRRAFTAATEREIARSARHGYPLSMLLVDVDHFKSVNDRFGHGTGDRVLAAVGGTARADLRATDLPARWGGEEFVVACPSTDLEGTLVVAERLRGAIERMAMRGPNGEAIPVTVSIGVAQWRSGEELDVLVDRADRAMYAAKMAGRNRVCSEQPESAIRASRPVRSPRTVGAA